MLRSCILLAFLASLFLGCGSYEEVNDFSAKKCGNGDYYDVEKQFCREGKIYDKFSGYRYFTDVRDNRVYKYVNIGAQMWMAENLRYETSNTKCYDDDPENCRIFGILYDWNTAKIICPSGWHLPNDTEWFTLRNLATDLELMSNNSNWKYGSGTDNFGFTALPGGCYRHEGYFLDINENAIFWSATAGSYAGSAHTHVITSKPGIREIDGLYTDNSWANVRCLKD